MTLHELNFVLTLTMHRSLAAQPEISQSVETSLEPRQGLAAGVVSTDDACLKVLAPCANDLRQLQRKNDTRWRSGSASYGVESSASEFEWWAHPSFEGAARQCPPLRTPA